MLRAELRRPSWKHEHVALGTNTDPYQWVEGRYRLMEGIWEALRDAGNPCSVLTKSPLLLRDLPLMLQIAERASFSACLSIPTLDEKAWRATEPHTPSPRARLEAVAELNRAGIPTGVLIAPLMPGINDAPHQVEPLLELAAAAGASSIGGVALHLRGEVRQVFMDWLRTQRPDLVPRYEELYRRGAYAPREERDATVAHGALARHAGGVFLDRAVAPIDRRASARLPHPASRRSSEPLAELQAAVGANQRLSRWACVHLRAIAGPPSLRTTLAARSGARPAIAAPPRERSEATSTSPRLRSIACTTALATSSGERVPTPGGSFTSESANMPASRMKPGNTHDTPTPPSCRSVRSAAANPRSPYLVAW